VTLPERRPEAGSRKQEASRILSFPFLLFAFAMLNARSVAAREKVDLLVTGATVVTLDSAGRVLPDGAIAVSGQRIVAVGSSTELRARYAATRTVDARGQIAMPGLINGHNHAPMVLFRGIADDLALMDWLQNYIFPAETRNVTPEFVEWGTLLACVEMIRSGTTTFADMYYFEDQVAEATARAGLRGILGETVIQFPVPDNKTPAEALAYTEKFIRRWKGHPLITPAVAPHAPYTNSAESLRESKNVADRYGVPLTIHVSETRDEVDEIRRKYDATSTEWLEKIGVLGPNVIFNHGVWLTEGDMAIVRRHGVSITHNPESNMKLASGTAPVSRMLALGIDVGIGTDGAASNNDLDMFETMDFTAKLQKLVTHDPTALPARKVVEMATIGGARALKIDKETGSLEPGKRADFILVDTMSAHATPMYNVYSHLAYALKAADVRTTVVDGRILMLQGRVLTLDETRIREKARMLQARIRSTLTK
jgi:5-methylthioadenosine/S-adenosylhomocysteine deaminase